VRKRLYTNTGLGHGNRPPSEVVMAAKLLGFTKCLASAFRHMLWFLGVTQSAGLSGHPAVGCEVTQQWAVTSRPSLLILGRRQSLAQPGSCLDSG